MDTYPSPDAVFARLDDLRRQRAATKAAERAVLEQIKTVLRTAVALRFDGQPINRTLLIAHSGLSRRTAYLALLPEQPTAERDQP